MGSTTPPSPPSSGAGSAGTLFLAGTSLGTEGEIPPRSLEALREADVAIFEEDRPARKFLKAAGIHRSYLKLTEHAEAETLEEAEAALRAGKSVVYMSDQGTPSLADPGTALTAVAYRINAAVRVIPGPSSLTAAISACPFDLSRFRFEGFLPRTPEARTQALKAVADEGTPAVIMDTPYRLKALLESCQEVFTGPRRGFLALDISGPEEAYWVGSFGNLAQRAETLADKRNFVLIVEGAPVGKPRPVPSKKKRPKRGRPKHSKS